MKIKIENAQGEKVQFLYSTKISKNILWESNGKQTAKNLKTFDINNDFSKLNYYLSKFNDNVLVNYMDSTGVLNQILITKGINIFECPEWYRELLSPAFDLMKMNTLADLKNSAIEENLKVLQFKKQ